MSLIIKGMEMPKMLDGEPCYVDVRIFGDGEAVMAKATPPYYQTFKAVPLPEKHGRLVDARELQGGMMEMIASGLYGLEDMIDAVIEAPTIVPAEGGGGE